MTTKHADARTADARTTRCLILNPVEADLLAAGDGELRSYLTDLAEHVGGWEGADVEFCDPLGAVVLTVRCPDGVIPWVSAPCTDSTLCSRDLSIAADYMRRAASHMSEAEIHAARGNLEGVRRSFEVSKRLARHAIAIVLGEKRADDHP